MKKILLLILICMNYCAFSQTADNFKIEHNPSKLTGKLHIVNTPGCKMDSLLYTFRKDYNNGNSIIQFFTGFGWGSDFIFYGGIDSIIPDKHGLNDTVMTLRFNCMDFLINSEPADGTYINYSINDNTSIFGSSQVRIQLPLIKFTPFFKSNRFNPCFVSVLPNKNTPTVYWESIPENMLSYFIIKRNGVNIDTIPYKEGTLSYLDSTNMDAASFTQAYTIEAVDSSDNHRSGITTTLRVRNLASINGNIEMDWSIPTTSATINNFIIYEYKTLDSTHDTLVVLKTIPPNITQYTISNPNINSSYLVGTSNLNCSGTALKNQHSNLLLSNKLNVKGSTQTTGIEAININEFDEVIGHFDLLGREIDSNTKNEIIITRYKSGRITKKIR